MTPKMRKTRAKRVTYPTGLVSRVQYYQNDTRTLRIEVSEDVYVPPRCLPTPKWCVEGTMIPRGATGALCHESLPCEYFLTGEAARKFAVKLYRRFASHAA